MRVWYSIVLLVVLVLVLSSAAASATEIYVDPAGGGDYTTINAALAAAAAGDTIVVACGTYREPLIDIQKDISIRSETRDPECVILDGEGTHPIMASQSMTAGSYIEGLTFANGYQTSMWTRGGGLLCWHTTPTIRRCVFRDNVSEWSSGGALAICEGVTVEGCEFYRNSAPTEWGGAIHINMGHVSIRDCVFVDNHARFAGAIGDLDCAAVIEGCAFEGNTADLSGGALDIYPSSSFTIRGCSFVGNECPSTSATIDNTGVLIMEKSVVAFGIGAPGIFCRSGASATATLSCCDIFGNAGGDWVGCVGDQLGIDGNIHGDPLFCDLADPDGTLTVYANSPCAPAQSPCGELIGSGQVGCDVTPVKLSSWGAVKSLYR